MLTSVKYERLRKAWNKPPAFWLHDPRHGKNYAAKAEVFDGRLLEVCTVCNKILKDWGPVGSQKDEGQCLI